MDFEKARFNMVENQIRANRVTDPAVLTALERVPRELFVPKALRGIAYVDEDIALDDDRYLMEPLVVARLIQAAAVQSTDIVLDVGCATGYSSAVLAHIASTVVALESDQDLVIRASRTLTDLSLDNAVVVGGPLIEGYPQQAPYDVIMLNGAVPSVPEALRAQLADGGRLVAVLGDGGWSSKLTVIERHGNAFGQRILFDAATPALPGFIQEPQFVF
ncbi:protein-L-isoaspartate O-methyltransferase [Roseospira marina]|uniref:Protein-L-isoaspartate O-methyltransferase n=2 Tax=Roseospira marina TaxID=140057 RepID=A0A5M6IFU2_9PROT|nr:protein-L-isoaspartate O-methyltransferase [Roseospira marina]KAA5607160.1 protein-L-isoaspartate O-methyltransferase [Roseospira marina]MBB4312843.1 protein-L-isoaspartate(D-aspartate) O-methyltransferase [Roseospira marina]